jgi:outer membrane protein assembly factor BamB
VKNTLVSRGEALTLVSTGSDEEKSFHRYKEIIDMNIPKVLPGILCVLIFLFALCPDVRSDVEPVTKYIYKTIGERKLIAKVYYPDDWSRSDRRSAILMFQGNSFNPRNKAGQLYPTADERAQKGMPVPKEMLGEQFSPVAEYLARRGMVAVRAEYRRRSTDGVMADKAIEDAVSAMRWVRKNARALGINPDRIVVLGSSGGGCLAASLSCIEEFQATGEDRSVSPVPNAMLLYFPLLDWLAEGKMSRAFLEAAGGDREYAARISPARHWSKDIPPTLVLIGTRDPMFECLREFVVKWKERGSPIEIYIGEGGGHGFSLNSPWLEKTTLRADEFLCSIGFLNGRPGSIELPSRERRPKKSKKPRAAVSPASTQSPVAGLKWRFQTGGAVHSSPDIANGIVCFGSLDGNLYAVDAETGKEVWKFATDKGSIKSSPDIEGTSVYCGAADGRLYAVDLAKGTQLWSFKTRVAVKSSPLVRDGAVYFGAVDGTLYAIDAETSRERWKFKTGDIVKSSPCIADGILFVGSGDNYLYALDAKTGKLKWRFKTGHQIISSPHVSNSVVYFGSSDAYLYAVDVRTGKEKWKFQMGDRIISSPRLADGLVYCGSNDGFLYAVDSETGFEKWKFETGGGIGSSPAVARGLVIVGSRDGWLYALDKSNGLLAWKFQTADDITSSPFVLGDTVYFGSMDGNLYAVNADKVLQSQATQIVSKLKNTKLKQQQAAKTVRPTYSDVVYGPHKRNRLDLWQAQSERPAPVLIYFHGGSFKAGDKSSVWRIPVFESCLKAGISVVSANYRFSTDAPFPAPMLDGARVVQFVRHKAREWNIDPSQVSLSGGSAGGTMALWIALHDDLAAPESDDPISQTSTRVSCVVGYAAPASMAPEYILKYAGSKKLGGGIAQLFGVKKSSELAAPEIRKLLMEAAPINHVSKDDPPLWLTYRGRMQDVPFPVDTPQKKWIHHICLGMPLQKIYDELGLECHISDQGNPPATGAEIQFLQRLFMDGGIKNR